MSRSEFTKLAAGVGFALCLAFTACTERADQLETRHERKMLQEVVEMHLGQTPPAGYDYGYIAPSKTNTNPRNLAPDVQERIEAMGGSVEGDAAATAPTPGGEYWDNRGSEHSPAPAM